MDPLTAEYVVEVWGFELERPLEWWCHLDRPNGNCIRCSILRDGTINDITIGHSNGLCGKWTVDRFRHLMAAMCVEQPEPFG